jgi:Bacterial sugar transferase
MLVLADRFAALLHGLFTFCVPRGGARTRTPITMPLTDPVAREFAHVRRHGWPLAVVSVSVLKGRGASRRVARIARDSSRFKLRSMTRDADSTKERLRYPNILSWPDFKVADDRRVTRTGRWLRKYSLDALPQLRNASRLAPRGSS